MTITYKELEGSAKLTYRSEGGVVGERVAGAAFGTEASALAAAVDIGGGVTFAGGRMDLRATYSLLVGSSNVPGFGGVTVGYSF